MKNDERIDELHRNGYRILQKPDAFCFGMDAVLLADFAKARKGEKVLDLCAGGGIISILMEARYPDASYYGLEIQEEMADMACRNVQLNGLEEKIKIRCGDLRNVLDLYQQDSMQVVTCNPPYMKVDAGLKNREDALVIARHEVACTLDDVCSAAEQMLSFHGRFYMVHRPSRLPEIINGLVAHHLEPKRLRFVHPYVEKAPNLVLIEAVYQGRPELTVLPPLIVYESPGRYSKEIYEIYGYEMDRP